MAKILLLVLVVAAVLLLVRGFGRRRRSAADAPAADPSMVRCAHCGLHLPRDESLAADGRFFCSEQHRGEAERRR
jgi:uncharacterized protein